MGLTIEQLKLDDFVTAKARKLLASDPKVVFTSGRRDIAAQARAMAQNVKLDKNFVKNTYVASTASKQLQAWVDANGNHGSAAVITNAFAKILNALPSAQQMKISKHLSGRAFDIKPGSAKVASIMALSPRVFLTHEGKLKRWHIQF